MPTITIYGALEESEYTSRELHRRRDVRAVVQPEALAGTERCTPLGLGDEPQPQLVFSGRAASAPFVAFCLGLSRNS
jgi:hypothetical protein